VLTRLPVVADEDGGQQWLTRMTAGTPPPATERKVGVPYSQRIRTERQIAIGRAVLAAFSLAAVWLDPAEREHFDAAFYSLTAAYVVYAVLMALLVSRTRRLGRLQVVSHAIDIGAFSAFIYFTDGPTSLFFVFFVFVVVTATLRWQWRGVIWTTVVTVVLFLGLGIASAFAGGENTFELNDAVVGVVYLGVVAWLLAFLGLHEARLRQEVGRLATWSRATNPDETEEAGLGRMLAQAASIMGVPRAVLAWEDEEEPWLRLAFWDGHTTLSRAAPEEFSVLVRPDLEGTVFLCPDVRAEPEPPITYREGDEFRRSRGTPVDRAFADRYNMGPVISVPVDVPGAWARLFLLDKPNMSADDLTLASIVAAGVGLVMEESHLQARLRESAAYEERVHLARDLHDGVLQSLTGTALQLETARRLLGRDVPAAEELIQSVQQSLVAEQRDLRLFVNQLRPREAPEWATALDLRTRLLELRENIARQWGLEVEIVLEEVDTPGIAADGLTADVYFIIREGLVNSARHAHATRAWATVRSKTESLEIELEDDGSGFPFLGRHDMASLKTLGVGPIALLQRVTGRGGTLVVDSGVAGSRIEISLPLETRPLPPDVDRPRDMP
jgi:signal transduction histidine kinase